MSVGRKRRLYCKQKRHNRSTGDLLVYPTHIWSEHIEKHGEALAVSLDNSKAFDRVCHGSLIDKLSAYGLQFNYILGLQTF